jgi:hypothetical protein
MLRTSETARKKGRSYLIESGPDQLRKVLPRCVDCVIHEGTSPKHGDSMLREKKPLQDLPAHTQRKRSQTSRIYQAFAM